MVWINKNDSQKQIIVSAKEFKIRYEFSWDKFTEETCPIEIEEFKSYNGIPIEIIARGFDSIKNYLRSFGLNKFVSFTGLK